MKNLLFLAVGALGLSGAAFQSRAGDVDRPNILWGHRYNGQSQIWRMNGSPVTSLVAVLPLTSNSDTNWQMVGRGEFSWGIDSNTDLIWWNDAIKRAAFWGMSGGTNIAWTQGLWPTNGDPGWRLAAVADLDNDNHTDLLWQHADGTNTAVWFMNRTNLATPGRNHPACGHEYGWLNLNRVEPLHSGFKRRWLGGHQLPGSPAQRYHLVREHDQHCFHQNDRRKRIYERLPETKVARPSVSSRAPTSAILRLPRTI
jgi:hypothetical protein